MDGLPFTVVDIVLFLAVVTSAVIAFSRGFVREVLTIAAWIGAIVITIFAYPHVQPMVRAQIDSTLVADVVTGLSIFIVTLVVFTIVTHAISRNVRNSSSLGAVDRSLGFLFGVFRGVVLICALYLVMMWWIPLPEDRPIWIQNARSRPMVEEGAVYLASILPEGILKKGESLTEDAARDTESLIEAGEAVQTLTGAGTEPAESGAESDGAEPEGSGYNDAERNQMNQVIQSTE